MTVTSNILTVEELAKAESKALTIRLSHITHTLNEFLDLLKEAEGECIDEHFFGDQLREKFSDLKVILTERNISSIIELIMRDHT